MGNRKIVRYQSFTVIDLQHQTTPRIIIITINVMGSIIDEAGIPQK